MKNIGASTFVGATGSVDANNKSIATNANGSTGENSVSGQISMFEEVSADISSAVSGENVIVKAEDEINGQKAEKLVGFSTGDAELDMLIGGVSDKSDENTIISDDFEKSGENDDKTAEFKNENLSDDKSGNEDYSYYGTIKPLAENAGIVDKKAAAKNAEKEKAEAKTADDLIKAEIEKAKMLAEKAKIEKANENERVKSVLNAVKPQALEYVCAIKSGIESVYDEIFKNNPAFKNSIESIVKNLEEYVQALLLSRALMAEIKFECYPEFVYEILPEGDIFKGTFDDLSLNVKMANVLKTQPTAMLMLAAVDVSFNRRETKELIDNIYSLYNLCVTALGQKAPAKDEVMFNMLTFAKNQGVIL